MYSPHIQVHTGRLGTPFLEQSTDSGQVALFSKVRQMSAQISALQELQGRLLTRLEKIEAQVNALENPSKDKIGTRSRAKKMAAAPRGGANDHPTVKVSQRIRPPMTLILISPFHQPLVHMLFYEMCGVNMSSNKAKRTAQLCAVKPLEGNLAFKLVDGRETWHPRWKDKIDNEVNAQFIQAVISHIQKNEEVSLVSLDDHVLVLTFDAATLRHQQWQRGDKRC